MKKAVSFIFVAFLLMTGGLSAMDWPSTDARLVRNFGWNDHGEAAQGSVFHGRGFIQAAGDGEILFSGGSTARAANGPSRLPSPLGAWTSIDHGDGIISMYGNYDGERTYRGSDQVKTGTPIAVTGKSGWADEEGFSFYLYDRRERRWVNPSMIIAPLGDTVPPVIQAVQLQPVEGSGRPVDITQVRSLSQGRYTISVAAADALAEGAQFTLAPYRLICSSNGTEAGSLTFETFSVRDGIRTMNRNGLTAVSQIYAPYPRWELGEVWLTRGQANIEVIAEDIAGNIRRASYRFQVE